MKNTEPNYMYYKNGNLKARRCTHCREFKNPAQFHKSTTAKHGIQNVCRACRTTLVTTDRARLTPEILADWFNNKLPSKIRVDKETGCWLWNGGKDRTYGQLVLNYVHATPHRLVLEHKLGRPLADGTETSHLCHNPRCVNPDHLVEETHEMNMMRRRARMMGVPVDTIEEVA